MTKRMRKPAVLLVAVGALMGCERQVVGPTGGVPHTRSLAFDVAIAPGNDDFDGAVVAAGVPFTHLANTSLATTASDDPDCYGQGPTVWYAFTPAEDGLYQADTFGSNYDTTLGAYTGTRGDLYTIDCNDDFLSLNSRVLVYLQAGQTTYFMVGSYGGGPGGDLVFNLLLAPPPPPPPPPFSADVTLDPTGSVTPRTGVATIGGTLTCSRLSFVTMFGVLRQRIGRVVAEAIFSGFYECDGTERWEVEFSARNALLTGGPADVFVEVSFFDPLTGQQLFARDEARVRLGGRAAGGSRSLQMQSRNAAGPEAFSTLDDVFRQDWRVAKYVRDGMIEARP